MNFLKSLLQKAAKNKKVVGALFTGVLMAVGVANPELISSAAVTIYCGAAVKCDA
jgi:hypothetical protein